MLNAQRRDWNLRMTSKFISTLRTGLWCGVRLFSIVFFLKFSFYKALSHKVMHIQLQVTLNRFHLLSSCFRKSQNNDYRFDYEVFVIV